MWALPMAWARTAGDGAARFFSAQCARPGRPGLCVCLCFYVCVLLLAAAAPARAQEAKLIHQGTPTGSVLRHWQSLAQPPSQAPPLAPPDSASLMWQNVQLPDKWVLSRSGFGGQVWYRSWVNFEKQPQTPWGLYLPRVVMNADVWVNGVLVGRSGVMDGALTRHWNTPLLFNIPGSSWRQGLNTVHVRVAAYADNAGGLAPVHLGRFDVLSAQHQSQIFWQNDLVYACNIGVIALGLFVLAIWARRRTRADYGYFGVGAVLWGVSNFNFTVREPPLATAQWELFVYVSIVYALVFLCLFNLRFSNKAPKWLERTAHSYVLVYAGLLILSGAHGVVLWGKFGLLPVLVFGAWAMYQGALFVRRTQTMDYKILSLVQAMTLGLGVYDWLIQAGYLAFNSVHGLPYVAPLLLAALGWWIAGDYARTHLALSQLNQDLEARVLEKEAALRQSFDRVAQLEKDQAVNHERSRIMRDMHDGVGMHLSSAIRQLQSVSMNKALVEQTLLDSLDQLKLTVDSMNFRPGDVASLLGSLRFRLAPRLEAVGLALDWHVDELPPWPQGDAEGLRHLQYILFELVSNALQHARATELSLSATHEGEEIVISVSDNGVGLPADVQWTRKGMSGVRQRAQAVGASVQWHRRDEPGVQGQGQGCSVVLRLQLGERPLQSSQSPRPWAGTALENVTV